MSRELVVWATLQLALAALLLFVFGPRLKRERPLASFLLIQLIAWAAWLLQRLALPVPPWAVTLAIVTAAGLIVPAAFRGWNPVGHAAFGATAVATAAFLGYALDAILVSHTGPWILAAALLLLALQVGAMALLVAHTFEIVDVVCRTRWDRAAGALAAPGFTPKVSLHVPIHDEPPELVAETLDALARLRYPDFEVIVVDNNTADEALWRPVERHCAHLGPRFRFYHLMPWPGYKAGALNYALSVTAEDAAIVGVVDADYVVEPDFLADLVGHFADPGIAFVQTPQDYRDGETRGRYGRALYLAYLYFFKISMASRNERNAIIYAGTMGLIRRSALVEVGGWDEWCITEDAEVALRLLHVGYGAAYVDRSYGRGLMPLDVAALRRQRFRWAFGGMQLLRRHAGKLLVPWRGGRLTAAQRLMFLSGGLQWLHDPLTFAFSILLLLGAAALGLGYPFRIQPLAGAVILTPLLFIVFAVARFLWALRLRLGCTWRETADALTVLLGLTWVVTQACVRGLVSRKGEFLRTPKQAPRPTLADTVRAVRAETALGGACLVAAAIVASRNSEPLFSARGAVLALLVWQAAIYLSAVRSGIWNYLEAAPTRPGRRGPLTAGRLRLMLRVGMVCFLGLVATPARAEAQELIAGWEGGQSRGYAFASPVVSIGLGAHELLVLRGAASELYYQLPDAGGVTKVNSPGASAGLGFRLRAAGVTATLGTSYEMRRTTRRFPDGTSTVVTERGLTTQADAYVQASPLTSVQGIVSYGAANRYLWARAGLQRQITNTGFEHPAALAIGAEATAQGNGDVRAYGAGAVLALTFLRARTSLQLHSGYEQLRYADGSRTGRVYWGIGAYSAL